MRSEAARWLRLPGRQAGVWAAFATLLAVAPFVWSSSFGLTTLIQMAIAIIACLAFNVLLGQGGMLSFGHAVYSGLGSYLAIHVLAFVHNGQLALPVSLVPLVGGLAGLVCAIALGYVTTRRAGTTFAMITLGMGELVLALAVLLPQVFGGEGGIASNRVAGPPWRGITFGPQRQLYALAAVYCFASTAALFAFTRTPLGRMLNAVRDNAERAQFLGYDAQRVRHLAFAISGFFMGIAGGLSALHYEIVQVEVLGSARSTMLLLFVFLGGAAHFCGPMIGAVLMVLALGPLSQLTHAWLLYVGLAFMVMVMVAPGGIAGLVVHAAHRAGAGGWRARWWPGAAMWAALLAAGGVALGGTAAIIEMLYHLRMDAALGPQLTFLHMHLDVGAAPSWLGAAAVAFAGAVLFEVARRALMRTQPRVPGAEPTQP